MMMKGLMMHEQQQLILEDNMSNLSSLSGDQKAISTSENRGQEIGSTYHPNQHYFSHPPPSQSQSQPPLKKKRNLPGNPDPEAEVIALSPKTLMATNRFVCEICNKGFQRDQNLQLHRRGHNLPWKLKQRSKNEVVRKKVYVCPEVSCVHHEPSRALGDLTGIKKHFCRKHGEKKWKCDKCSKKYAVQSDWKAHSKTCGTREYRCDCGTLFSRRDSFITHRAFCDALAEESARTITRVNPTHHLPVQIPTHFDIPHLLDPIHSSFFKKEHHHVPPWLPCPDPPPLFGHGHRSGPDPEPLSPVFKNSSSDHQDFEPHDLSPSSTGGPPLLAYHTPPSAHMSATALLQKAAQMGTSHLSRGTTVTAPCTTSCSSMVRPQSHHQQYQGHVSAGKGTSGSSGLHLSSRDHEEMMALASYGNKAGAFAGAGAGGPSPHNHPLSSSSPFHDHHHHHHEVIQHMNMSMMMMSSDDGSTFEDAFSQILDAKKEEDDHDHDHDDHDHLMMMHERSSGNGGNIGGGGRGNDGMTRDFLGLRALSHGDIMTIAGAAGLANTAAPASLQEP